jgi:hypothetical protein
MACLPLSNLAAATEYKDMTALLLLTVLLIVAGILGNIGRIKNDHDPDVPQRPFIRHS